jgi:hypothetical protein
MRLKRRALGGPGQTQTGVVPYGQFHQLVRASLEKTILGSLGLDLQDLLALQTQSCLRIWPARWA